MGEKANITTEAQLAEPQPNTHITTETRRKPFRKKAKATAKAKTTEDKREKFSNE
jgi:hypothetical protein